MKTASSTARSGLTLYWGLFIGVMAVSWASILVKWCGEVPAIMISFYRLFWSALLFVPLAWRSSGDLRQPLSPRQRLLVAMAGVFLALHFLTWIAALKLTPVAHALTLGSTHPVFAVVLAPLLLREKSGWRAFLSVGLTVAGIAVIAGWDSTALSGSSGTASIRGDFLAVISALFVTFYLFTARYMRGKMNLRRYLLRVYGAAALTLLVAALAAGYPLVDYSPQSHFLMLLLALVPTGIGHSLLNWAAQRIQVYKVNLTVLGEPLIATVLAFFFFQEVPQFWFYPGALLILAGIVIAVAGSQKESPEPR